MICVHASEVIIRGITIIYDEWVYSYSCNVLVWFAGALVHILERVARTWAAAQNSSVIQKKNIASRYWVYMRWVYMGI